MPYLYAVDRAEDVPVWADATSVAMMRQEYATHHLESFNSGVEDYDRKNAWPQLLGAAYMRKIYSFESPQRTNRTIDLFPNITATRTMVVLICHEQLCRLLACSSQFLLSSFGDEEHNGGCRDHDAEETDSQVAIRLCPPS